MLTESKTQEIEGFWQWHFPLLKSIFFSLAAPQVDLRKHNFCVTSSWQVLKNRDVMPCI